VDDRMNNRGIRRLSVLVAGVALLAAACGGAEGGGLQYKDPDDLALFEVPEDWNLYTEDELLLLNLPFVTATGDILPLATVAAFDAGTGRSTNNLLQSVSSVRYPVGTFSVRNVSREEREFLSRGTLEQMVLWPENFTVTNRVADTDFDFGNDYEGVRRVLQFEDPQSQERGAVVFVSVTNPDDSRILSMAVGCSEECFFEQYAEEIIEVVDSWVVNTSE
jgi:hypothetical protein